MKCFAGCAVQDICSAVGIQVRDLFWNSSARQAGKSRPVTVVRRRHWRGTAAALENHAMGLHLRAESILAAAKGLDPSTWSEADLDRAIEAVSRGYRDEDRAALFEEVVYSLRAKGLEEERRR
jgi:hypothetical protein